MTRRERGESVRDENGNSISLRTYIERILEEYDKRQVLLIEGQQRALEIAASSMEQRLEKLNELRQEVTLGRSVFVTRELFDAALELINKRASAVEGRLAWLTGVGAVLVLLSGIVGSVIGKVLFGN